MTDLVERLRSPSWSHASHREPILDEEDTIRDMLEAADVLEAAQAQASAPINPNMPAQQLRLHMGELTASELRVARAAIAWANTAAQAQAAEVRREKEAVICLLYTDEVFVGTHWEAFPDADKGTWPQLCAHVWSYGADAEEIPQDQIVPLADLVREFGKEAVQAWVCHRRGEPKPDKGSLSEAGEKALAAIRALTDAAKGDRP